MADATALPEGFTLDAPAPAPDQTALPADFRADPPPEQDTSGWRYPKMGASEFFKGLAGMASSFGNAPPGIDDPFSPPNGGSQTLIPDHDPGAGSYPDAPQVVNDTLQRAGLVDRPELTPEGGEKAFAAGMRGAGAAAPFAVAGGPLGAALGIGSGFTGGVGGEMAADAFPLHPLLARSLGELLGGLGTLGVTSLGSHLAKPAVQAGRRALIPGEVDRQAADAVTRSMMKDNLGPADAANRLAAAQERGTPLAIVDIGGENVQGQYGKIYRTPDGTARQDIRTMLDERDAGAGERITGQVDKGLTGGKWQNTDDIIVARKAAAQPAYEKFESAAPLNPDTIAPGGELDKMMSRPSMNKAGRNALELAKEEGRDPASLGITFAEDGSIKFERVPSWQTLDYVKRGLDDVIEDFRDPVTKTLNLNTQGRAANDTRSKFVKFMDRENPAYKTAREAWGGPTQSLGAAKDGAASLNLSPTEASAQLRRLSPGDQALYRQGASEAYAAKIGDTSLGGNEALGVMGNQTKQQRLLALSKDNESYNETMKALADEKAMFDTKTRTMGNSATAQRTAEDANRKTDLSVTAPMAAGALIEGSPVKAAGILASPYLRQVFGKANASPEVNAAIVKLLHSQDPGVFQGILERMNAPKLPGPRAAPAGLIGTLLNGNQ